MGIQNTMSNGIRQQEPQTEWRSMCIASAVSFFTATQFTIFFSSLWPYLQQLDPNSKESQFGYITAFYSLGQAIASPLFGYWGNRINSTRIPTMAGIMMMILGNMVYLTIPLLPFSPMWVMFVGRGITGFGAGIVSILRTFAVQASTTADRSRAISLNTGGFTMGLAIGPAFQLLFTPLGFPGVQLIGALRANIYTCPAMLGIIVNIASLFCMQFLFQESSIGVYKVRSLVNVEHQRFFALPKYDRGAVLLCIATRFVQMFVITNLETIGSPLSMIMFSWDRATAVYYNSYLHVGFGLVGLCFYVSNAALNFGANMNQRTWTIFGILLLTVFHLLTYPWWFLPGKIQYQKEYDNVNGTLVRVDEPIGCRPSFEWCADVPPINVYLYFASYIIFVGISFPIVNVTMSVVYSTVIGPRNQGTMQGMQMFAGSIARMIGPLFVATSFEASGPRIPWIIEITLSILCAAAWIIMYNRMVPLKMPDERSAGETFKNKHGKVIKF